MRARSVIKYVIILFFWKYVHVGSTLFICPNFNFSIDVKSRKDLERLNNLENKSKRRDRLSIIADILTTAKDGSLKTQIMYKANLSFAQLNEYLSFLIEIHLLKIQKDEVKKIYNTTDKGNKYLEKYNEISNFLGNNERKI
jgi:predicted transcriptional regulator